VIVRIARPVLVTALVLGLVPLVATGCGSKGKESANSKIEGGGSPGAKIFADAGCSGCHTLATAGASGTVGPNLDELRPNQQRVEQQVRNGGNGMPSFADKLSGEQIRQVAAFIATSAGTGTAGKISFEPDDKKVEDCHGDAACFEQAFGNVAYNDGPKAALDQLEQLEQTDPVVRGDCHPIAHKIGAGGLLYYEGSVGKAFAAGTATCAAGYYHGLLQWKLAGVRADQVAGVARTACEDPEIKTSAFNYYQCNHGLGHGLMLYTAYDLPQALGFCHKLNTRLDSIECSGGVFMENQSSSFGLKTKWLSNKNLLYPCNSKLVRQRDKLYCYLLVTSHILPAVGGDWKKTADWCRRSDRGRADSGETWTEICFQSYGRDVSGAAVHNPEQIRALCAQAGSGEKECLYGAVRDVLNNNSRDLGAKTLCENVAKRFRSRCFFGLGTILGTQHADLAGKQAACAEFAKGRDLTDCVSGAGG
jgi:cytochrome c553